MATSKQLFNSTLNVMPKSTYKVNFYARDSKKDKNGQVHIELSITVNQKRLFVNLPYLVEPSKFNSKRMPKEYADYISLMRTRINEIMVDMLSHQEPITAARIREYVKNGGYKSYTINDMFNDYLEVIKKRVGKEMSPTVYRKYELVKELYLEDNDGTKEVTDITTHTVEMFHSKLIQRYETSTTAGYMTKLKTFVRFAIDNGKLKVNPFNGVKINREQKPIDYLTEEEIETLINADIVNKSLRNVLDLFLFQCSSGLSYIDILNLEKNDVKDDGNGHYYINKKRIKTGVEYTAVILPFGVDILKKYDYNLNVISNQKFNVYLHIIEKAVGINKSLHSHLARHSYLTYLLNKGIRLEVVSSAAGHSSTKITQKYYAKLKSETTVKEISQIL